MNFDNFPVLDANSHGLNLEDRSQLALDRTFLDSLHSSRSTLVHGTLGQSVSSFLFYLNLGDVFFLAVVVVAWAVWAGRMLYMKVYDRNRPFLMSNDSTARDLKRWVAFNMVGTGSTSAVYGGLAGYSIAVHPGTWAAGVSLALALGVMISVIGRNHGSTANVTLIITVIFAPIVSAFIYYGITSNIMLGFGFALLLVPFILSTKSMTFAVRMRFLEADRALKEADRLKKMFYDAVSNMPDGLMVITRAGKLKFATKNARRLFDMPDDFRVDGKKVSSLLEVAVRTNAFSRRQASLCDQAIRRLLNGNTLNEVIRLRDDLFVEFSIGRDEAALLRDADADESFVLVCADVTDRIKSADRVSYLANYDMLSEMPNRRYMRELILDAHAKMGGSSNIAFCVFDVDKFKDINDTLGHASGDEVIKAVGRSMIEVKERHPSLIISRLGGDEFVMALPDIAHDFPVGKFFDDAFATICREYDILGKDVDVRCSGGVIVCSREGFQFDDAYTKADLALYQVKQKKRKRRDSTLRWKLFDDETEMSFKKDQQVRLELTHAIAEGRFLVHYQPMFTPDGLRIETFEALTRWERPGIGVVCPEEFIPIAESMNIIGDITRHVVERACMDCATWHGDATVSVNLSVLDLARYEVIDMISEALRKAGLPPTRLQVEITESIFLKDTDKAKKILTALHEMGVKTAIDDFGTGYSNLGYINKLPLNKVKIDKSFIKDIDRDEKSMQLFEAVVSLGKKLNLGVIVEGVETAEQLDRINEVGVDLIQGFIFGRPMGNEAANELLSRTGAASSQVRVIPLMGRTAASH
ncbi:EAL domain-containing protein [Pararhizobium sp. BT-229]|uniref:putative bifunctional diguanylate cyclase/phosphodiesterase n=1 Tax=Pararhizobium sp. BT-229 TaxID=2986923 RepID=UPI0021F706C3|nr:EAL domain-containing protein [Pararhizobium sp. BT-229]MCV9963694.1 EAL domain-containing protein [Pararhizobium sp. BT-229]